MVTGRHAAALLSDVLPTREHARLVLRAGLAGPPVRAQYDEQRVLDLAGRPPVSADDLAAACPGGLLVIRLPRETSIDTGEAWAQRVAQVGARPFMPTMSAILGVQITVAGRLPWVATLCGYAVLCAEVTGLRKREDGRVAFTLAKPGAWAHDVAGRLLRTRRGRPWLFLEPGGAAGLSARGGR
jgi:hypothetical protein